MSESDILGEVLRKTGPLTSVLDEVMAVAIADAEQDCARYPHEAYPFLRSFHVRARTRQLLEVQGPPQGWQLAGNPRQMGQLILSKPGEITLRLLRGNPLQPDKIPPAGFTQARARAWKQDPLPEMWSELAAGEEILFLALWDYLNPKKRLEGFTLRFVHPLGKGKFRGNVPCDLDVTIPRGGTLFEDLEFVPQPEDEDLFSIRIFESDEESS